MILVLQDKYGPNGVTGGERRGQSAPQRLLTGKVLVTYREKEAGNKKEKDAKWRRKEGKLSKGSWKIENGSRKCSKMRRGPYFFVFVFVFVCFLFFVSFFLLSLFKTTKICFGSTKIEIFYWEKAFHAGKKLGQMTLPPQKHIPVTPLYGPCLIFPLIPKRTSSPPFDVIMIF